MEAGCCYRNAADLTTVTTAFTYVCRVRKNVLSLVDSGQTDWSDVNQRQLLRSVLMTTCDIAAITKPWDIQLRAANLVIAEFFDQGDKEKNVLKIQPPVSLLV